MIRSGIAPLDREIGGLVPGRIHLLTGGVGTGKTTACLHFVAAGLDAGERVAMLTLDRPPELRSHAAYLGIDLATPLLEGRLVVLRYRREFARRFAEAASTALVAADLRRAMGGATPPARLVIDPLTPFLADGSPAAAGLAALIELLEGLGATAVLTYPGSLAAGTDRRLDAVVDRAAVIASLSREPAETGAAGDGGGGGYGMRVARARLTGAPTGLLPFRIEPGVGLLDGSRANGRGRVEWPVTADNGHEPS